jgi:alpha-amylase
MRSLWGLLLLASLPAAANEVFAPSDIPLLDNRFRIDYGVTPVSVTYAKNVASLNIRGTTNNWGTTPMSLVGDHLWQASVTFTGSGDGNGGQRFKFDVKGDWTQNYGDTNKDGVAELAGADITTAVVGAYVVRFNDQTLAYSLSAQ